MSPEFIVLTILAILFSIIVMTLGERRKQKKINELDMKVLEVIRNLISGSPDASIRKDIIYISCKKLLGIETQEAYESVERLKKADHVREPGKDYPGYGLVSTGYIHINDYPYPEELYNKRLIFWLVVLTLIVAAIFADILRILNA